MTDGNGKGRVKFENFKNINILTSIKSFNVTSNIKSITSYANLVDPVTNEYAFLFIWNRECCWYDKRTTI